MITQNEILRIVYLNQIVIGVLGNSFLIFLYCFKLNSGHKTKSIFLILIHFLFTNIILLLFRGIPKAIDVWGLKYFVDYTGSVFLTYMQRVTRSLSLCSCTLLSVFQAIKISPSSLRIAELKTRALKCIFSCCLFCWVLNLLIDIVLPLYVIGLRNRTYSKEEQNIGFSALDLHTMKTTIFLIWKFAYDAFFVSVMAITSGCIVLFLYRHHQRVRHMHRSMLSQRGSSETHAAKAILLLVITFVSFNFMSSFFVMYMTFLKVASPVLLHVSVFLSLLFPTVSPFILLKSDTQITSFYCVQ
ncbi:vomeronasal type-1 receptor 1-like [Gracilinanus agilis]|uniref:vomeronasal type-1 receptor 1-like n=1 Tax=Gracilinanus agilis TaxID=191870 RepID=UPI001CFE9EC2|nr:vomeronasal type-1 receptor 1-like [Gracilinanus agilis]